MRAQHEQAMLVRRMAVDLRERSYAKGAAVYEQRALEYEQGAEVIRRMLAGGQGRPA
jgi:hypothetical protein